MFSFVYFRSSSISTLLESGITVSSYSSLDGKKENRLKMVHTIIVFTWFTISNPWLFFAYLPVVTIRVKLLITSRIHTFIVRQHFQNIPWTEPLTSHSIIIYVLWYEKRGHQLVPLKRIKEAPTPPLFMLCQQNCACMQNDTSTMLISNLD